MAEWFASGNSALGDITRTLITKEFLESVLQCSIKRYTVGNGSNPGDNYMSVLYALTVTSSADEEAHYLLKCYPSEPNKQETLNRSNHFFNELEFYSKLVRDLTKFLNTCEISRVDSIIPPIPPFHGGKAINYRNQDVTSFCGPLDNFILMTDLREWQNFKMADRRVGLDGRHIKQAFHELATFHALTWGYIKSLPHENFIEMYPFLEKHLSPKKIQVWMGLLEENANIAVSILDSVLGAGNKLSDGIRKFCQNGRPIYEYFVTLSTPLEDQLRKLLGKRGKESPDVYQHWRVVCHGDCWTNQILFQYDKDGKPERAVLVDYPLAKLGCPTFDLACLVYTSTRRSERAENIQSWIQVYYNRFLEVCHALNVSPLDGFSMDALQDRFHTSKLPGFLIALLTLHLNLVEECSEDASKDTKILIQKSYQSGIYREWIVELIQEMFDDGVI